MLTVTVSQINRYIKAVLEENEKLRDLYVKGELRDFRCHSASGHCYFTLGDEGAAVRAVMFASHAERLAFRPENGMQVLVRASVSVYERAGDYQLYVTDIQPHGAGAAAVALEQRKKRLAARGVFDPDRRKPLPAYPKRVGVVTSEQAAALQDIRTVLARRWPLCTLVLAPALVQGEAAAGSLRTALQTLDRKGGCDVILLSRGGGSSEDLGAFNDEALVLAVAGCRTPVVSAVGHETDTTLCDLAADLRAPTPSAAAELATPDIRELAADCRRQAEVLGALALRGIELRGERLDRAEEALRRGGARLLGEKRAALARRGEHPVLKNPRAGLERAEERLDICTRTLYNRKRIFIQSAADRLAARAGLLDSLSPLRVLDRGYCLAFRDDKLVTGVADVSENDELRLRLRDGSLTARVQAGREEGEAGGTAPR